MVVLVALCAGCAATPSTELVTTFATAAATELPATPSTVPVTLYFRSDKTGEPMLAPVEREIPRGSEPSRRALEMLVEGPQEAEGLPVIPSDTVIEDFSVVGTTAKVTVRGRLDEAATSEVSRSSRDRLLTLAAITNTLTEFPSITEVELDAVDLDPVTCFAGWGIPQPLVRDETFIEPAAENDPFPALGGFSINPQETGSQGLGAESAAPATVTGVRVIDRLTYVRVAIELEEEESAEPAPMPWARARTLGDEIVLTLRGVAADGPPVQHDGPGGPVTGVRVTAEGDRMTLTVSGARIEPQPFTLITEHSPSRVLLDVKK